MFLLQIHFNIYQYTALIKRKKIDMIWFVNVAWLAQQAVFDSSDHC